MVRRHEIQVLRRAGHSLAETATLVGVSPSSVQRVAVEPPVTTPDHRRGRPDRGFSGVSGCLDRVSLVSLVADRLWRPSSATTRQNRPEAEPT